MSERLNLRKYFRTRLFNVRILTVNLYGIFQQGRQDLLGSLTNARCVDESKEHRSVSPCRTAQWLAISLVAYLSLHTADAGAAAARQHFDLEAGEASVMLNEFSRQTDLQVLFDFNIVRGMKTHAVEGDYDPATALKAMLKGTDLVFDFVNDHTLAVTPKQPSFFSRLWHRVKTRPKPTLSDDSLEQVLISGAADNGTTQALLGSETLQFGRNDIDRSGLATTEDFLRTLPQVFGGGPNLSTVLGREAQTNSAHGAGINLRGLDAGATLVLIDGQRLAPSGTAGAFEDISNIPLSIVDHIDVLPDGSSARYDGDAVGGVVNFVTRNNFSGIHTQVRDGGVTNGSMGERQFSQFFGNTRDSGSDLLAFEYYQRDPLRAHDRWQQTSDLTPYGGSNFDFLYGSPGTITDGTHYWPLPKRQNGTSLNAASLLEGTPNLYDQDEGSYITPQEERWSVFGRESFKFADTFELFTEGLFTRRKVQSLPGSADPLELTVPQTNPFYVNPTGVSGPVTVVTGSTAYFGPPVSDISVDTGNFSLSGNAPLGRSWTATAGVAYTFEKQHEVEHGLFNQAALDAALADPNPATAFNPFGDGSNTNSKTLASISGSGLYDSVSSLRTANLIAKGPTLPLPGGDVEATVGTEYRIQSLQTIISQPGIDPVDSGRLHRAVIAGFGDLRIPIVGEPNELGIAKRLELSAGVRSEHFSDVGSITIPKFGLLWSLRDDLSFQGTWTKSFKPPNLADMVPKNDYSSLLPLPDPSSPNGVTNALVRYGTNPSLRPETARSWTLGTNFAPKFWPGTSLSLTYFNISYSSRIDQAIIGSDVLSQPNTAWLVNRNYTQSELNDVCSHSIFTGAPGTCTSSSIGAIVDDRLQNVALLKTKGVDFIAKYGVNTAYGRYDFGLNSTYLFEYAQASTPGSPLLSLVSTQNNPINFRARGSAGWTRRGLSLSTFVNFANSYRDTASVPNRGISPWTTVDLQLSYETQGDTLGWLDHIQFALNVQNLFNVYPPFLNNSLGVGYDQENATLYGRLMSFEIRKRW